MADHRLIQQSMQHDYRLGGTSYTPSHTKKPKTQQQSEDYKITKALGACPKCRKRHKKCPHSLQHARRLSQLQEMATIQGHPTGHSGLEHSLPEAPGYPSGSYQVGLGNGAGAGIRTVLASTVRSEESVQASHAGPSAPYHPQLNTIQARSPHLMPMPILIPRTTATTYASTTNSSFEGPVTYTSYEPSSQCHTHATSVDQYNNQSPQNIYNYRDPHIPTYNQQPSDLPQYAPYLQIQSQMTQLPNNYNTINNFMPTMNGGENSSSTFIHQTGPAMRQQTDHWVREAGAWSNDTIDPSLLQISSEATIHANSLENYPSYHPSEDINEYWSYQ